MNSDSLSLAEEISTKFNSPFIGNKSVVICGEKNTGKSSFSLYMINYLLSKFQGEKIIFLDTDLG